MKMKISLLQPYLLRVDHMSVKSLFAGSTTFARVGTALNHTDPRWLKCLIFNIPKAMVPGMEVLAHKQMLSRSTRG